MNRDLGIHSPLPLALGDEDLAFAEKRRFPRRQLSVRCWMGDGSHTVYARVHDVSLGGLSIRVPVPFSPDTKLELALVVTGGDVDDPNGEVSIRARGRVVWVRDPFPIAPARRTGRGAPSPGAPRMGAEFVQFVEGEALFRRLVGRV